MLDRTRIRTDVWEIHANGDTLIFGRTAALLPVPKDIRGYRIALQVLNRMIRNHEAARQIRAAYLEWSSRHLAKDLSEAEILRLVEDDIAHHRISVIALPHVYLNALASKSSAAKGGTRRAHILSAMAGRTAPSAGPAGLNAPEPPKKPVIQWELTDKFIWVFKRTAKAKVGPEIARMLMEMIKPEKLAEMLVITEVLAQVTLAANATPVGWVWDLALAGIAYYFGGLAALEALKDVMIFLIRTIRAQTESDLEIASEALARAALALTAAGLMVLLHKIAARKGTGSPGGGEEPPVVTKGAGGGKTGEPPSSRRTAAPKDEASTSSSSSAKKSPSPSTSQKTPPASGQAGGNTPNSAGSSPSNASPASGDAGSTPAAQKIDPFKMPKNGNRAEMERQLKEQQDKINSTPPDELLDNLKKFDEAGRPNDATARQAARDDAWNAKQQEVQDELVAQGVPLQEAEQQAARQADAHLAEKDATHSLDWVAGGDGEISGVGGSTENRSIGSQWAKKGESGAPRREQLRDAAQQAKDTNSKMNIILGLH